MNAERNVLCLLKNGERYVFLYDDIPRSYAALVIALDSFALDPELDFTWPDALLLQQRARRAAMERQNELKPKG